jgi:hypothetical protein
MRSNYFKKIAGTAVMAFSLILGISSITSAQSWDPYQNDRYRRQQQEELRRQQAEQLRQQQDQWGRDQWGRRGRERGGDGYPNLGGWEFRQTALNAGYGAGNKEGRKDRDRGGRYQDYRYTDYNRFSSYRDASKDYNSRYRDRELYSRYFRLAFVNGYADGLRGY